MAKKVRKGVEPIAFDVLYSHYTDSCQYSVPNTLSPAEVYHISWCPEKGSGCNSCQYPSNQASVYEQPF